MEGWEGRFEPPAVAGKVVVLVPILDLTPEDRLPLVVTLVDGTQVPITVTADKDTMDHQVNFFWDPETVRYLRADLENALGRERRYREESERYAQEANSPDRALAALLATGSAQQTKFRARLLTVAPSRRPFARPLADGSGAFPRRQRWSAPGPQRRPSSRSASPARGARTPGAAAVPLLALGQPGPWSAPGPQRCSALQLGPVARV
ncbi:MAG: DUF2381 family protein [Hyalangium sp.]|uniref:DUF2381 family protein n=1 Tax=Hyalangium sp. TaxID=2028555 RepID=UPI00389AFA07